MKKFQNLLRTILKSQTVKTSFIALLSLAAAAPLLAQTVNTVRTGVYYSENTTNSDAYCNFSEDLVTSKVLSTGGATAATNYYDVGYINTSAASDPTTGVSNVWKPESNRTTNDPWVSSALIEYDQPYPTPTSVQYPNQCLGLCAEFACSNLPVGQSTYSIAFPLQRITFDIFKYYNGKNPKNADELPSIRSIDVFPAQDLSDPSKFTCGSYHCSNAGADYGTDLADCLGAHWICDGTYTSTTTSSCTLTKNTESITGISCNTDACPVECELADNKATCVSCTGKTATCSSWGLANQCTMSIQTATSSNSKCWPSNKTYQRACDPNGDGNTSDQTADCKPFKGGACGVQYSSASDFNGCCLGTGHSDCVIFDGNGAETNATLPFCTGWDGFYEIAGEFGKTNGNYGFRATAYTNVPSDGVINDRIEIEEVGVYPGHNGATQIPIQIDVTNVHTVRSTPSLVGTITPVSAQPYTFTYRLSKDADVRIAIFDASTTDTSVYDVSSCTSLGSYTTESECISYGTNCTLIDVSSQSACNSQGGRWIPIQGTMKCCEPDTITLSSSFITINGTDTCCTNDSIVYGNSTSFAKNYTDATAKIVRTLVDWQPRTGEGMKGTDKDTQISDFDSWDGRNDAGLLLPAGNYLASIQAKSQDEWPGIDFSRAVTRQVSLDPLKLTDVQVTGLNKKSTAYATISYVPTEPSTVYWEVYTPGTMFQNTTAQNGVSEVLTNSSYPTGTGPKVDSTAGKVTGSLVYRSSEQKSGRMNYTQRWDGTCQPRKADGTLDASGTCTITYAYKEKQSNGTVCNTKTGCTESFAYGAPMPDGNYVYVLWAEVPYNGCYYNAASSTTSTTSGKNYYGAPHFEPNTACEDSAANNNKQFTGVKTLKYTVGNLELERGLVGITMQPATYATLGSSPTAYGLDPFVFKYALDRDAQVIATVENTAGVVVKHLTLEDGEPSVAQQLNTLTWDGRDDQGRMVYPGTYMFRVKALDAMFPAQSNEAITIFPVDMYRVVDVATTDVYGDSNAKATISYHLSKTMNAQINIYNKDVVIPNYNSTTGDYNFAKVTATYTGKQTGATSLSGVTLTPAGGTAVTSGDIPANGSLVTYEPCGTNVCRNTWTSASEYNIVGNRDKNADLTVQGANSNEPATGTYTVYLTQEVLDVTTDTSAAWPPRICNTATDAAIFTAGYVDPAKVNNTKTACIYVNDTSFTNYPASAAQAASGVVDVRLQPIHTFDRSKLSTGDDVINMEEWDALYFYNPNPSSEKHTAEEIAKCKNSSEKANCPYEMLPDGQYPFFISARSNEPFNRYYYDSLRDAGKTLKGSYSLSGQPFTKVDATGADIGNQDVQQEDYLYASDKVVHKINVTRGPVYFLDGSVNVYPNAPQLFNASSTTLTFIPPYEINFAISRAATVEVAIVALQPNMCSPVTDNVKSGTVNVYESRTNMAGDICKFLSTMTILNTGNFDANAIRKLYWDGTDHNGNYVKPGTYEVRLTARNYPDAQLYQPTVKSITLNADLLKVYDLLETDNYAIALRGQDMKIGYQISVPMKVAIQIFKPGTTIYDYAKGTLRNPTTGKEVQDIREVLVRAITGIRPGVTLIEEVWDGRDYAQQEVPDGVYPFRFVTSLDSAAIDSVTGEILFGDDTTTDSTKWKVNRVADTYQYQNLHKATVAVGDGRFVCEDWQKTVFFYPNPFNNPAKGTLEITKMPVPGTVSIKYFNLAGDLVRDSDYTCVDANNYQTTMGKDLYFQPDNNVSTTRLTPEQLDPVTGGFNNVRNAALRCKWDRTNQHGKKVARGVYFGLIDFKAYNGREHCQKVVKILIP